MKVKFFSFNSLGQSGRFFIFFLALSILSVGCGRELNLDEVDLSNNGTNGDDSATATPTCVTAVIDDGIKQSSASTTRGDYSDIEPIPGGSNYALAYFDTMADGILITWYNGTSFQTEMVAGDNAATYVNLEFLSSGIPLIFWANASTTVKVATRSAALGTEGFWTASIMETMSGGATRALKAEVNPADEVGIIYMSTNTAATQRPRFIYCSSNCSTPSNFTAGVMATAQAIESPATVTINQVQTDLEWCGHDSNTDGTIDEYYPAVVYQGTTNTNRYSICKQSSLANCLTASGWSTVSYLTGTSVLSTELHLDPTINGDYPKIWALNPAATSVRVYRPVTSNTCYTVTPAAFTASANLGDTGSTTGNAWMHASKNSNDTFNLVANVSTTSLRYWNSTSTDPASTWNNGTTVLTSTLSAASHGAAMVNGTQLQTVFGVNAAPYNVFIGAINDVTNASSLSTPSTINPDGTGHLQPAASQTRNFSLATTDDGRVGIAFIDNSNAGNGTRFVYAFRNGTSPTDAWITHDINFVGTNPKFPSLAFDHNDKPWVSYFDNNTTAASSRFYLLTNPDTDGSSSWVSAMFPDTAITGVHALPAHNDTAVAMYYSGAVAYPVMMAINNNAGQTIKAARITNTSTMSFSSATTIATLSAQDAAYLSSDFNSSGTIVLGYQDLTTGSIEPNFATSTDGGATWTTPAPITAVSGGGQGLTIKLDPSSGFPAIAYYDRAANKLYYATCNNSPTSCNSLAAWTVTDVSSSLGISALTNTTTGTEGLLNGGLSFTDDGVAQLFHTQGMGTTLAMTSNNLRLATIQPDLTASYSTWVQGAPPTCMNTALHFGVAGWNVQSVVTSTGETVSAYIGPGDWLYHKSCSN